MSSRFKVSVTVMVALILIAGCGKSEPTATPTTTPVPPAATPTATLASPTATPVVLTVVATEQATPTTIPDSTEPTPAAAPVEVEEVSFQSDHFKLVGDLQIPGTAGKHPAIIMVHGDGEIDRTDSGKYRPIMERFLRAGYAVFSWDKPGTGESTGELAYDSEVLSQRTSILVRAIELLKEHPAIDPGRIGVWGISQAGYVMPLALRMTEDIAFMIVTSGPAMDSYDQGAYLLGQLAFCAGASEEEAGLIEQQVIEVEKATTYQEYLENSVLLQEHPILTELGILPNIAPEEEWEPEDRSRISFFNPIEMIERTTIPVLAFFGERDRQVDPFQGAQAYEQALQKAGNQNYRVELIPGVNHVLALAETGCMNERRARVYAPEYLDLMEEWLVQLPTPLSPLSGSDGGVVAFTSDRDGNEEIYVMNVADALQGTDGSDPRNLTHHPASDDGPHWSPDGSQIAFSSNRSGNYDIYIMDLADALQGTDGTNLQRLTQNPAVDAQPAWSPDGTQIAFVSLRDGNAEIYVMNVADALQGTDGSSLQRLTRTEANEFEFDWSPDGTQMVFASSHGDDANVYVMNSDGSGRHQLTETDAHDFYPRWSPNGTRIAFLSTRDGGLEEIYVMDSDGSNQRRLTTNDAFDGAPSWSPDGTQLVFASDRDGNHEIYVMDVADALQGTDGANVRRLTDNSAADRKPAWCPSVTASPAGAGSSPSGMGNSLRENRRR